MNTSSKGFFLPADISSSNVTIFSRFFGAAFGLGADIGVRRVCNRGTSDVIDKSNSLTLLGTKYSTWKEHVFNQDHNPTTKPICNTYQRLSSYGSPRRGVPLEAGLPWKAVVLENRPCRGWWALVDGWRGAFQGRSSFRRWSLSRADHGH